VYCTKISPEFKFQVKGQGHREQKKRKTAESSPLTMHSKACTIGHMQQAATDDTIAPPGVDELRRGKISACCLVFKMQTKTVELFFCGKEFSWFKAVLLYFISNA